jgi:hypothetical protein
MDESDFDESTLFEIEQPPRRMRVKRIEDFGIVFVNGLAEGWIFGVHEAFRASMDVNYTPRVDKERTKAARRINPKAPSVYRKVWTRGNPPLLSFERGHVFHGPLDEQTMNSGEASKAPWRIVRVRDAAPDGDNGRDGWVVFDIEHYEDGRRVRTDGGHRCSQADFEKFLRSGVVPRAG